MQGKVSVGLSTVTGYGVTTAAFVGAVLAYLGGDHSNQTVAIIACGVVGALAFAITNIGRQRQAVAITNNAPAAPLGTGTPVVPADGGSRWLDLDGDGIEDEWKLGADGVWVRSGVTRGVAVSNAGPVTEGPGDPLPNELADVPPPEGPVVDVGDRGPA